MCPPITIPTDTAPISSRFVGKWPFFRETTDPDQCAGGLWKTTVVCEWMQNNPHVCWLSLEKSDDDPHLFFTYLAASLQKAFPSIGKEAPGLLDAPQVLPLQTVLTFLLNDLTASSPL
jgi:ATP/maltotriose-dependent transcriptional regulator MalT